VPSAIPSIDEELVSAAFVADPYPLLARLRVEQPVYWSDSIGGWVMTRYDDITVTFKDTDSFSNEGRLSRTVDHLAPESRDRLGAFEAHYRTKGLLHSDPPDHTRLRRLVNMAFTPPVIEAMRPRIQQIVDGLLDRAADKGEVELIEDFAFALPVTVLAEILGVPPSDSHLFRRWADGLLSFQGVNKPSVETLLMGQTALVEARDYLTTLLASKRTTPDETLLSRLARAEAEGDSLSHDELINTSITFLVAGHETTTSLIGNGVATLLQHPAQLEQLRDDPTMVQQAVEEILRYESPVARQPRLMKRERVVGDRLLRKGDMVFQMLNAANRDPMHFDDPEAFVLARPKNKHIAFGLGAHFCVGAPLSRAEGQIAIRSLLARFPKVAMAGTNLHWDIAKPNSRVLTDLWVTL
jgi:cytochrome P450